MIPLVSICLPTLNARGFIEPRMDSILAQTLTDWELIVCDSHSDDGAWEYIEKFRDDSRVRGYRVPREGLYAGWNECLRRANGKYVYMATADDTCRPELLERMVEALETTGSQLPIAELSGSQVSEFSKAGSVPNLSTCQVVKLSEDGSPRDNSATQQLNNPITAPDSTTQQPSNPATGCDSTTQQPAINNSFRPRSADIAVCDFDFIDESGRVIDPPPRGAARSFYGDWLNKPHLRNGYTEFLVHTCLDISWTTMTAVVFRRSLLDKTGPFRADCGAFGDKFWAMKSALFSDTVFVPGKLATWRCHAEQRSSKADDGLRRRVLEVTAQTIDECAELLPERWRRDPEWRSKLLRGPTNDYLAGYHLNRHAIRSAPLAFLSGCARAAVREPGYLARRIASGFSWNTPDYADDREYLMRLIGEWNAQWPPVEAQSAEGMGHGGAREHGAWSVEHGAHEAVSEHASGRA